MRNFSHWNWYGMRVDIPNDGGVTSVTVSKEATSVFQYSDGEAHYEIRAGDWHAAWHALRSLYPKAKQECLR